MAVYSDNLLDERNKLPIEGAELYVYTNTGVLATLTDALDQPLSQPLLTGADGDFEYKVADGVYRHDFWKNSAMIFRDNRVIVGTPGTIDVAVGAFGETLVANATAADARSDLGVLPSSDYAASGGSALVGFLQAGTGATVRTAQGKMRDMVSVKDFGATGDGVTNDAAAIQAAIDAASTAGGGSVHAPAGTYNCGTTALVMKPKVTLLGDGYQASVLQWANTHTGDGIKHTGNRNFTPSLVRAYTEVRDLAIKCSNGSNVSGGGYVDESGVFVALSRVLVEGFGYSVILDQSELADVDQCILQSSNTALIWIVNGPARIVGTDFFFTNRISVSRCQLDNGVTQKPLIIDDGGYSHSYIDNNYNGGTYHIRAAGVSALKIDGGEFEGNFGQPQVILTNTTAAGTGVGGCVGVELSGGLYFSADSRSCIKIESGSGITICGNYLGTTGAVKIDGAQNAAGLNVFGNHPNGTGALLSSTSLDFTLTLANGANNDIAIPAYAGGYGSVQFLSITGPSGAFDITGFAAGVNGQCILVYNGAAATGTIKQGSASSAVANRINTSTGIDYTLGSGVSAMFVYREAVSKWIQVLNA